MDLNKENIYDNSETIQFHNEVPNNCNGLPVRPNSKIEIRLSCNNLTNLDVMSKSDPKIYVFYEDRTYENGVYNSTWKSIGCTESVKNDLNPKFKKSFIMDYYFQYIQNLRFIVVDVDDDKNTLDKSEYIGYVEKSIGELLSMSNNNECICEIKGEIPLGIEVSQKKKHELGKDSSISIYIEEVFDINNDLCFDVEGIDLDKKDIIGKSDPYFVISKPKGTSTTEWIQVYKSSIKKITLNPLWEGIKIELAKLNNGDNQKKLKWEVYDWDAATKSDFIGSFEASVSEILINKKFDLINPAKKEKNSKYVNSGILEFKSVQIVPTPSFTSFPINGTEVSVNFAIDFTASNGEKEYEDSLHYINKDYNLNDFNTLNAYQKAIAAIGQVLEPYDTNRFMGVYGYGGFFDKNNKSDDKYPLNGSENPYVYGVKGLLETYSKTLKSVMLAGPTLFSPMINMIVENVKSDMKNESQTDAKGKRILKKYSILVFITDGCIDDMDKTLEAVSNASELPISIIIIGVGQSKFENMKLLDGDERPSEKKRDIVQFVPLK